MEERLGILASSVNELEDKLTRYLVGEKNIHGLYRDQIKQNKAILSVLTGDDGMRQSVQTWIAKRKYATLLELWAKGLSIDWNLLYSEYKPHCISAPTYPFAKERYWITQKVSSMASPIATAKSLPAEPRACLLAEQWQLHPGKARAELPARAIIFTRPATLSIARTLAQSLPRADILLPSDIQLSAGLHDTWIDLCTGDAQGADLLEGIEVLQTLIQHAPAQGLTVLGVTFSLEACGANSSGTVGAGRAALYRMLSAEYREVRSRHVDLDAAWDEERIVQAILDELTIEEGAGAICRRDENRYRLTLAATTGQEVSFTMPPFPADQVLLVTGGTRGIGLACAEHLVKKRRVRKLVLTGREELPPRADWPAYMQRENALAHKLQGLLRLEAEGAEVHAISLALSSPSAVANALAQIRADIGPIGGVLHCAGLVSNESPAFIRKTAAGMARVLEPKVSGLNTLLDALVSNPPQFIILFSSVSAIIPSLAAGLSDYSMANAYMDAVARARRHGLPITSVRWSNWKEVGIGEAGTQAYSDSGLLALSNAEGVALLDQVLACAPEPVVLPAVIDPMRWDAERLLLPHIPGPSKQTAIPVTSAIAASTLNPGAASPATLSMRTLQWLATLFSGILKIPEDKLDADTPLAQFGVDSIMLADALHQINQALGVQLDPSLLLEYPSLQAVGAYLFSQHAQPLTALLGALDSAAHPDMPEVKAALAPQTLAPHVPTVSARRDISNPNLHAKASTEAGLNIAVVGMSCRFPGAHDLASYRELLESGGRALREVPADRWPNIRHWCAGLLDDVRHFDPGYFLIKPEDARAMDPQALLVLEEAARLFSHAGYTANQIKGYPIGVYLGARSRHQPEAALLHGSSNPIMAVGQNYLAANISRFYDLHGPSLVVDTACSSALTALQLAVQALRAGDIETAVVGGASLLNDAGVHELFAQRNILCGGKAFHVFDARDAGIIPGEGVGMVLIKRMEQALQDGDTIYGCIQGLAVNNDGRTAGVATPNLESQKQVLQAALAQSGKQAHEIRYIEANASGSEVTDLIELKAIAAVYGVNGESPCSIGSVKPNIGHLLCAEGIAGLIKLILMLKHGVWMPCLSGQEPMQHGNLNGTALQLCHRTGNWTDPERIGALNCFADGGTNAHVIVQAWDKASYKGARAPIQPPLFQRIAVYGEACEQSVPLKPGFSWPPPHFYDLPSFS
jgi:3-oxoacyl-(acyl-carrier-protein) synthase/NAD(P)-dependent dehydrogenase (short-subunit alcohol dehydrogenase family)/acyl carrier protein